MDASLAAAYGEGPLAKYTLFVYGKYQDPLFQMYKKAAENLSMDRTDLDAVVEGSFEAQYEQQLAEAAAREKHAAVEDGSDDDFDDFDNDPALASIQEKRLAEMKARAVQERVFQAQGHGEYREIVEEDFLKEVCGSENVVVHFYHNEFIRCKVVDKHMRIIAPKHKGCKFLHLNAEKAPFFVAKLHIQMLPTIVVFKDGIAQDRLMGFEDLGGKDEFRTEVLEHWLSKAGCVKLKKSTLAAIARGDGSDDSASDDD